MSKAISWSQSHVKHNLYILRAPITEYNGTGQVFTRYTEFTYLRIIRIFQSFLDVYNIYTTPKDDIRDKQRNNRLGIKAHPFMTVGGRPEVD